MFVYDIGDILALMLIGPLALIALVLFVALKVVEAWERFTKRRVRKGNRDG